MTNFLERKLLQTATLWEVDGTDNFGDPAFSSVSPATISVRWEERNELFTGPDGSEQVARGVIYLAQDVDEGDYLFLGTSVVADPTNLAGAFLVKDFRKVPDLRGKNFERRALI